MLPLLFCLQIQPGEAAQVLFTHSLVHSGPSADPFSVVVGSVGPPVSLGLHISKDHILYGRWQSRDLPGNVGFPAAPGFTEVLQDCPGLVLFDPLRHHVQNIMHHSCPQLKVEM